MFDVPFEMPKPGMILMYSAALLPTWMMQQLPVNPRTWR